MNAVALPLTSRGTGAIAVVLLAGADAPKIIAAIAPTKRAAAIAPGEILHGTLIDPSGAPLDDALIVRLDAHRFELHLHGGVAVVNATLAALEASGAKRIDNASALAAGLLGRGIEAEIATTLPHAHTLLAAKLIIAQGHHGLSAWAQHWQARLSDPQHTRDLWRFQSAAQWLLARSLALARLLNPPRVAIIGPPNAGKSTLANALLGRPMSITSHIPGTTRDWVDAQSIFTADTIEVAVLLVDTAGLRDTPDPLEQQSIARSHEQAQAADIVLFVHDAAIQPQLHAPLETQRLQLAVFNKSDTLPAAERARLQAESPRALLVSAKHHEGLDVLMRAVLHQLDLAAVDESEPFAFTPRQRDILEKISHAPTPAACLNLLAELRQAP